MCSYIYGSQNKIPEWTRMSLCWRFEYFRMSLSFRPNVMRRKRIHLRSLMIRTLLSNLYSLRYMQVRGSYWCCPTPSERMPTNTDCCATWWPITTILFVSCPHYQTRVNFIQPFIKWFTFSGPVSNSTLPLQVIFGMSLHLIIDVVGIFYRSAVTKPRVI